MSSPPREKKPKQDDAAFQLLLLSLDSDPDTAGQKHENLRCQLIKFFTSHGCVNPEDLTDETIDRGARRIHEGLVVRSELTNYFFGIARNVRHEYIRTLSRPLPLIPATDIEEIENENDCLRKCAQLKAREYQFVRSYVLAEETERLQMAKHMGVSVNGLRTKVHRVREKLRGCRKKCLEKIEDAKII